MPTQKSISEGIFKKTTTTSMAKKRKTREVDPELQAAIDAAKEAQSAAAKAGSVFGITQRHLFFNNLGCPPSQ